MGVAAELIQVLGDLQVITGLLQNIGGLSGQQATKSDVDALGTQLFSQLGLIQNQLIGLAAQERQIWADLTRQIQGLGVQTGVPQQATRPVMLPAVPPAGYGGASASAVADAVWQYIPGGFSQTMGFFQENMGRFAVNVGTNETRFGVADQMRWMIRGPWVDSTGPDLPDRDIPSLDPRTIVAADIDVAAWINRVQPGYGVTLTPEGWATLVTGGAYDYFYDMSPWEFEAIRANNAPSSWGGGGAPVWPGLAGVTLGVPAALAGTGITVVGPMDGIIITLTSVPQPLPFFDFNGSLSWGKIGAVAFEDDNGDCEEMQLLGFEHAVYVPKSMRQASFCNIRLKSGTLGTATPWTKT